MALKTVPSIKVTDPDVQRALDGITQTLNQLVGIGLLGGNEIKVSLQPGNNNVAHKLGKSYQGYAILSQDAASSIYDGTKTAKADSTKYICLNSSASTNVIVRVY